MKKTIAKRCFSAIEYAGLIFIVAVALFGMAIYLKRALCGKYRSSADVFGFGSQYQHGSSSLKISYPDSN